MSKLQESVYRAATVTWIGDPAIQAGDIVEHRNTPVGTVQLAVMQVHYKFAGTSTFKSLGPDVSTLEQPTATDRKMRKAFEQTRQNYEELKTQINQTADRVEIAASKVENLKIGARNLIRNSNNMIYDDYYFSDMKESTSYETESFGG